MTTYACKACGADVSVVNGAVVRTCTCEAGVVAHLTATATGQGSTAG